MGPILPTRSAQIFPPSGRRVENTGTQSLAFAILPKISLNVGGIADNTTYEAAAHRGYTSYTGFGGVSWGALPTLSLSGRGGATYTQVVQTQGSASSGSFSPYAAFSIGWALGARSSLSFDYSHEITPTDQLGANGQSSDRVSANFSYSITPSLSAHLQGIYTLADITPALISSSSVSSYTETSYGIDTGMTYHYNSFLDFSAEFSSYAVSSGIATDNYTRQQVTLGITGTY